MSNSKLDHSCILFGTPVLMSLPLSRGCQVTLACIEELHRGMMVYQLARCSVSNSQTDAMSVLDVHRTRKIRNTKGQN